MDVRKGEEVAPLGSPNKVEADSKMPVCFQVVTTVVRCVPPAKTH